MHQPVRFLLDEDVDIAIAEQLRRKQPLLDVQTAREAGTLGMPDPDLLAFAAAANRVLVTCDESTMPVHFSAMLNGGHHSPGIVIFQQEAPLGAIIEDLLIIWGASSPDEWRDRFTYLPL